MDSALLTFISAFSGIVAGGLISYFLQRQQFQHNLQLKREENKAAFIAETTAKYFLSHKGYTDRSFELIKTRLGGFEDNELRKILVRAGAVRYIREDGSEWWRLQSRQEEYIQKKQAEKTTDNLAAN